MNNQLSIRLFYGLLAAALLTVMLAQQLRAQDQDDPPSRVARLGYLQGSVSFEPASESDWVEAAPNRPMTIGDKLWADKASRAEVQLGSVILPTRQLPTACLFDSKWRIALPVRN